MEHDVHDARPFHDSLVAARLLVRQGGSGCPELCLRTVPPVGDRDSESETDTIRLWDDVDGVDGAATVRSSSVSRAIKCAFAENWFSRRVHAIG